MRRALARGLLSRELAHSSKWRRLSQGLELSVAEDEALAELLLQLGEMRPHGREAHRRRRWIGRVDAHWQLTAGRRPALERRSW